MIAVVDASLAIKWFLAFKPEEGDADKALALRNRQASGVLADYFPMR